MLAIRIRAAGTATGVAHRMARFTVKEESAGDLRAVSGAVTIMGGALLTVAPTVRCKMASRR
jgi:uncharacterized membrane protein HdeD (DUF308 family)